MKFSAKLTTLFSITFLVGSLVIVFMVYRASIAVFEEELKDKLEEHAFHAMDKIDRMLFELFKDIKYFSGTAFRSRNSSPGQITERLQEFQKHSKEIAALAFFDLNRVRIADASGANIGKQDRMTKYWQEILERKDWAIEIYEDKTLRVPVFHFASIVKDNVGVPFGVVVAKVPIGRLYNIVEHAAGIHKVEHDMEVELIDKDGLILYSNYNKEGILKKKSDDWEVLEGFLASGEKVGSRTHYHLGEEEITTFARKMDYPDFKGPDWTLVLCVPTRVAYAPIVDLRNKLIIILSMVGVLILSVIVIFSLKVTSPIIGLKKAAEEIGRGSLGVRVKVQSRDEIGHLARAFNKMADDLNNSFSELIKKEDSLKAVNINLDAANKELESFAYIVSHDLKAPLRGIASLSNWLMTDYADKFDDAGRQSLNLLISRVTRLNNMIDGILHYSRVGRIKEELVEVDLKPMLGELVDMLTVPTHIEIKIETEMPTVVYQRTKILQVFQNLLSNAVKYMDKPKGAIRIGHVDEGDFYKFYVSDNGPGIEAQYFEKIFQIFQTLKPRDELESTGVGLTIAKKIVEMQGGKIWVESKPGEGSTFWFTIAKKQIERDNNLQSEKFKVVESEGDK